MSVHNEDIRKFNIPKALSKANVVPWDSEGMYFLETLVGYVTNIEFSCATCNINYISNLYASVIHKVVVTKNH